MKDKYYCRRKKSKKREYCEERYKNFSEDAKQRLVEYRKRYYECEQITARSLNKVPEF